jgi:hypothetical protein
MNDYCMYANKFCFEQQKLLKLIQWLRRENEWADDHHQPINVPTAGAKAFLKDYTK